MKNTMIYNEEELYFKGFGDDLEYVTICFAPGGILILPSVVNSSHFHRILQLTNGKCKPDKAIIQILKERKVPFESEFILFEGTYYEMEPHAMIEDII